MAKKHINKTVKWCETYFMKLCPEKCKLIHYPEKFFIERRKICVSSCLMSSVTNKSTRPKSTYIIQSQPYSWVNEKQI